MKKLLAILLAALMLVSIVGFRPVQAEGDNILKVGGSGYDGIFNAILSSNIYDGYVCDLIFEPLIKLNEEGEFIPNLATWEVSEDHKTYTFTLKDGITFSDGSPMTAEDVEFTFRTMAAPEYNGPRGYAVSEMEGYNEFHEGETEEFSGIKVIDEKTISFTFVTAAVPNIANLNFGILSKEYYSYENWEEFEAKNDAPMGSGPMLLEEFMPKEHILLYTNESYWDAERIPKIDGILINEVSEDALLPALESGSIDIGQPQTKLENLQELEKMGTVTPITFLGNGYTFMCFECTTPPFNDKRVRQACLYALDRKEFIKAEYKSEDLASVGMAPISPVSWAFPEEGLNPYDFDLEKAGQLLDEAGWEMGNDGFRYKDGEKLAVKWLVYTESTWTQTLSSMAADTWKQVGIDLTIELMDFNTVAELTMDAPVEDKPNNFDIYTMGFSLDVDPDLKGALFDADAYSAGGFDASGYRNDKVQELIEKGRTTFDQEERKAIYAELATILNDEVATTIVAYRNELWAVNKRVVDMPINTYLKWTAYIHDCSIVNPED